MTHLLESMSPDARLLAAMTAIVFVAALASSVAGFAFSALAGPPLVWLLGDPVGALGVLTLCSVALQSYSVWWLRRRIEWRALAPFFAAGTASVPIGVALLTRLPPHAVALGLGAFLVAYAGYLFCRSEPPIVRADWRADALVGALGGLAGGLAALPGLLVTLWCGVRGWSKERQRAIYQPFILAMQLETFAWLGCQAPASVPGACAVVLVPAALAATGLGLHVFRRLSGRQFGLAVNGLLLVSGVALLARHLYSGLRFVQS